MLRFRIDSLLIDLSFSVFLSKVCLPTKAVKQEQKVAIPIDNVATSAGAIAPPLKIVIIISDKPSNIDHMDLWRQKYYHHAITPGNKHLLHAKGIP